MTSNDLIVHVHVWRGIKLYNTDPATISGTYNLQNQFIDGPNPEQWDNKCWGGSSKLILHTWCSFWPVSTVVGFCFFFLHDGNKNF